MAMLGMSAHSYGQIAFGVSPGFKFNSAYFGVQVGENFVPSISIQFLNVRASYDDGFEKFEGSGSLIIPSLNGKLFLGEKNQVKPYLSVSISKPILSGKAEFDGEPDEEIENAIDDLSILGIEAGFGAEYFFNESFSIGGEFSFRNLNVNYENSDEEYEFSLNVSPTSSKITLNFYF